MRAIEARALIGQSVSAWTALNGVYVGVLEQVFGRPWRGSVRITGVLEPAMHLCNGKACRRGFRPGEVLEVGGANIKPTEAEGSESYLQVLETAIKREEEAMQRNTTSKHSWIHPAMVAALKKAAAAERHRLAGGVWLLR